MSDRRDQHLTMIQDVIARMANNSFALRGWSVTLVSALFALAAADSKMTFVALAYFPAVSFWVLDGYYLHQERLFRDHYDKIRGQETTDFSMATAGTELGRLDTAQEWLFAMFSVPVLIFHGTVFASILAVWCVLPFVGN